MFPEAVIEIAKALRCPMIAYTYSEPTMFFEYMVDTARLAREMKMQNVWVTCGYIQEKPLVELCKCIDAANVDLKSFDEEVYRKLNSGKLRPILNTLKTLKREGVWFEVTNLLVPTYTDDLDMIKRMCGWLVENLGPDYPLHFSRFHPAYRLTHLPSTPANVLRKAREIARKAGLRYVYIGNVRGIDGADTTYCPGCNKAVVERDIYHVKRVDIRDGKCDQCGTKIAGTWN
jgi:pyruvate formate lyase activating enzyme